MLDPTITLYGKFEDVEGWILFFEEEKVPFRYGGEFAEGSFSSVNVLVGLGTLKRSLFDNFGSGEVVFVVEPSQTSADRDVVVSKKDNHVILLPKGLSSQLLKRGRERGKISYVMRSVILKALDSVGLPYVHAWYYPQPCNTIFLFRQDVDYVNKEAIANLMAITSKYDIRGTYFINFSGEEEYDDKIGHFKLTKPTTPDRKEILLKLFKQNNEIANHGYRHWVFRDLKNNYQNITMCEMFLKKIFGIRTKGYASPGGVWNKSLAKAMEQSRLVYSSNGLSDGGLPYYPYIGNQKIKVLEIPFYFLCDASFGKQEKLEKFILLVRDYYLKLIEKNIVSGLPIAIMGHPHLSGKYAKELYLPVFEKLKDLEIPNFTIGEFAYWWKKRENIKISLKISKKKFIVQTNKSDIFIRVIYKGERHFLKTNKKGVVDFIL